MKKICFLLFLLQGFILTAIAQVGIGTTTPSPSSILELKSNNKALLFPRTSTTTRLTIPNVKGLMIYDSTLNQFFYNHGFGWYNVATGYNHWTISQNDGVSIFNNNTGGVGIGTGDYVPFRLSVAGTIYTYDTPKTTIRLNGLSSTTEARILFELPGNSMDYNITQFNNRLYLSRTTGTDGFVNDLVIEPQSGYIGMGTADPETRLNINSGTDVGNGSGGFLQLGLDNNYNIGFDNNEIQGRYNGAVSRLVLNNGGGPVQIGNAAAPAGYILAVNGKAICEELKIQNSTDWPDYVFHKGYPLKSIDELRTFINIHHHLPNIPDAATIEANGIAVGDMQKRMMEKIEELTLYILQLEDKYTHLSLELEALKSGKQ